MTHDFQKKLNFSRAYVDSDIAILKEYFQNCNEVVKSDKDLDKQGCDYIVRLKGGREIFVDVKRREKGASKLWEHGEPELALERYSVVEENKIGWTLNCELKTDYVLFAFDPADSLNYYIFPFQLLLKVFCVYGKTWRDKYAYKKQSSGSWTSQALFVPASVVLDSIKEIMIRRIP